MAASHSRGFPRFFGGKVPKSVVHVTAAQKVTEVWGINGILPRRYNNNISIEIENT